MSTLRSSNKRRQNLDANWGPLSDTISSGSPCNRTIPSRINWAVSSVVIDLEQGVKWAILVSRSTTTSIEFLALTIGRSVMKSIVIDPQGRLGIGRGCHPNRPWQIRPCTPGRYRSSDAERLRGISEAEGHDRVFEMAVACAESCLPFITGTNPE